MTKTIDDSVFSEAETTESSVGTDPSQTETLLSIIERLTAKVQASERNSQIQQAVFEIARSSTTAENEDFYRSIHEIVSGLTSVDAIIIALYHEDEQCVSFPYYVDYFDDQQQDHKAPLNYRGKIPVNECKETLTWSVIESNEVIRLGANDIQRRGYVGRSSEDWVGIPLRHDGKPIGVFSIQSYQSGFRYRDQEIDLMIFISRHIANALQNLNDRKSLRQANEELKKEIEEREQINRRMVKLSHQAGKAEIATGILHNIGNVLNSINVSAGLAAETLRTSKVESLKAAAGMLARQQDIGEFFASDQRGREFPRYLSSLAEVLLEERAKIREEITSLGNHLEHVKTVVSMQQTYAGMSGLRESVCIPDLLGDAELLLASSLTRHGVEVVREFAPLPNVMLEKQKLLQVFVNLLKNAKDSLTSGRVDGRRLIIRVSQTSDQMLQFEFIDNGSGIEKENLTKIFSHGFTTKSDGHGFGLHSCANAMKEMNGDIRAFSDGPGTGATFVLRLPCIAEEKERPSQSIRHEDRASS